MTKPDRWFIEERTVAFASLLLTKHKEVKFRVHAGADMAIDFLVDILRDGKSTLRLFGVQLVPYLDLPDLRNAGERVLSHFQRDESEGSFPLCVFVIGVRKPEGLYRWTVEPVIQDGLALLQRAGEMYWQTLDEAGVAHLIDRLNEWYDALNGGSPPKTRGRDSKAES